MRELEEREGALAQRKAGASDLDIVHSKACSYAAMRAFIGFHVLQEEG